MNEYPLIGGSICAVVLLVLAALTNVVGYQVNNNEKFISSTNGDFSLTGDVYIDFRPYPGYYGPIFMSVGFGYHYHGETVYPIRISICTIKHAIIPIPIRLKIDSPQQIGYEDNQSGIIWIHGILPILFPSIYKITITSFLRGLNDYNPFNNRVSKYFFIFLNIAIPLQSYSSVTLPMRQQFLCHMTGLMGGILRG